MYRSILFEKLEADVQLMVNWSFLIT